MENRKNLELVTTITNHYNATAIFTIHYLYGNSSIVRQLLRASDYILIAKSNRLATQTRILSSQLFGCSDLLPAIQTELDRFEVTLSLSQYK